MTPPCYNRPPRATVYVANESLTVFNRSSVDFDTALVVQRRVSIPSVFEDRCATWDGTGVGPNGEPYPLAHGWDCRGCRWLPDAAKLLTESSGGNN